MNSRWDKMLIGLKDLQYCCFFLACIAFVDTHGQRFEPISSGPSFFDDDALSRENIHFFGPPSDRFWQQFWEAFNYRGPLQENAFPSRPPLLAGPVLRPVERPGRVSRPFFPDFNFEDQFRVPEYLLPRRETVTPVRQAAVTDGEEDYERYRNYFLRRYGTNFVD